MRSSSLRRRRASFSRLEPAAVAPPLRLPFDRDAERAVLAEYLDPLHDVPELEHLEVDDFFDECHRRIFRALRGQPLTRADRDYAAELVAFAWPLTRSSLVAFTDAARRRRRLLALELERAELLRGA